MLLLSRMVVLLNGAFGVGKTTVARQLVRLLPGSVLFDPELIGFALKRLPAFVPLRGRGTSDYQDLALWRSLTVSVGRICQRVHPTVIVPMAFSNRAYLTEIRDGLRGRNQRVLHFCLTAPLAVVEARLRGRGAEQWCFRRAAECCAAHDDPFFAEQIPTEDRTPGEVTEAIADRVRSLSQASPVAIGTSSESPHSAQEPS
jgi:predicted kinase